MDESCRQRQAEYAAFNGLRKGCSNHHVTLTFQYSGIGVKRLCIIERNLNELAMSKAARQRTKGQREPKDGDDAGGDGKWSIFYELVLLPS